MFAWVVGDRVRISAVISPGGAVVAGLVEALDVARILPFRCTGFQGALMMSSDRYVGVSVAWFGLLLALIMAIRLTQFSAVSACVTMATQESTSRTI